ncbi:hypothetical protein CLV30_112125 [Haloactinopolyspora alba]|uniref:Lipoprotein LprG n=1 Tax=Haloactinopolyspora alba TaxID=648780 RepID=A0A2P8DXE2_9ACTN|nr:hypothetical protein [Haloactinopolyspora alba]PSL01885.1 hypothetical protein CLV30_112125 [Haloactinopolyspora alba]
MPLARRQVALGSTVLLAVAVAGCGGESEHPSVAPLAQISVSNDAAENGIADVAPEKALERAISAMESTGSYRVKGTTTDGNALNIVFEVGVGSTGTIKSGNPVKLVSVQGAVYVRGDEESMKALVGDDVEATIGDRWLALSPKSSSGFSIFSDGATFAEAVLGAAAPSRITGVSEVDGKLAVGLLFPDTGATLWVAATGEPLPLRFEEKGATAGKGVLTFSNFGADVEVTAPAEDEVLTVDELPAQ